MAEDAQYQFKKTVDFDHDELRLKLIRDLVGMANAGGGRITIGANADGTEPGLPAELAGKLDQATLCAGVDAFVAPDQLKLRVVARSTQPQSETQTQTQVIEIDVPKAHHAPLVLTTAGEVETKDGTRTIFAEHSIPVRRGTRTQPARRDDFRRWTAEAVSESRTQILDQLAMVVEAPADSRVRIIDEAEIRDEPSFFLSRSADLFAVRPERLLDGGDLVFLWLHRRTLQLDLVAGELLFQSALRKRSTLFLWLYTLQLPSSDVKRYIRRAIDMQDRDKSDGARSMLQVTAFFFDDGDYDELREALASSSYAHMREAAAEWPTTKEALASLGSTSAATLVPLSETELLTQAEGLLESAGRRVPRQVTSIGVELLERRRRAAAE